MPRRYGPKKKSKGHKSKGLDTLVFSGHTLLSLSYSSSFSFATWAFKPSAIGRLSEVASDFEEYKLLSLSIETLPSSSGVVALGLVPGSTSGTFSGWMNSHVTELSGSIVWYPGQVSVLRRKWGHAQIGQQIEWLLTTDANGPSCYLVIGGPASTAVTCTAKLSYIVQFRGPVAYGKNTYGQLLQAVAGRLDDGGVSVPSVSTYKDANRFSQVGHADAVYAGAGGCNNWRDGTQELILDETKHHHGNSSSLRVFTPVGLTDGVDGDSKLAIGVPQVREPQPTEFSCALRRNGLVYATTDSGRSDKLVENLVTSPTGSQMEIANAESSDDEFIRMASMDSLRTK